MGVIRFVSSHRAKISIRRELRQRIQSIPPDRREIAIEAIDQRWRSIAETILHPNQTVLAYFGSLVDEIPTEPILQWLLEFGVRLALPRVLSEPKRLVLHQIDDLQCDLIAGPWGLTEPDPKRPQIPPHEVDAALIPGLGFDHHGGRIGRGGGFYDRLLPQFPAQALRWALAFEEQIVEEIPMDAHDSTVDVIVTPHREIQAPFRTESAFN